MSEGRRTLRAVQIIKQVAMGAYSMGLCRGTERVVHAIEKECPGAFVGSRHFNKDRMAELKEGEKCAMAGLTDIGGICVTLEPTGWKVVLPEESDDDDGSGDDTEESSGSEGEESDYDEEGRDAKRLRTSATNSECDQDDLMAGAPILDATLPEPWSQGEVEMDETRGHDEMEGKTEDARQVRYVTYMQVNLETKKKTDTSETGLAKLMVVPRGKVEGEGGDGIQCNIGGEFRNVKTEECAAVLGAPIVVVGTGARPKTWTQSRRAPGSYPCPELGAEVGEVLPSLPTGRKTESSGDREYGSYRDRSRSDPDRRPTKRVRPVSRLNRPGCKTMIRGEITLYSVKFQLHEVMTTYNLAAPLGLTYPRELYGNDNFQRCVSRGHLNPEAYQSLSYSLGIRGPPPDGFFVWGHDYVRGVAQLEALYIGRCPYSPCRRYTTNYDDGHDCRVPPGYVLR